MISAKFIGGPYHNKNVQLDDLYREHVMRCVKMPQISFDDVNPTMCAFADDDLIYFPEKYAPLTEDIFYDVFRSIDLNKNTMDVKDAQFETFYVEYNGLRFTTMLGQGAVTLVNKI